MSSGSAPSPPWTVWPIGGLSAERGNRMANIEEYTTKDWLETVKQSHPWYTICPVCKEEAAYTSLVKVVYAFDICRCDKVSFVHLVQTLYHADCFPKRNIHHAQR